MNSALAAARKVYVDSNVIIYYVDGDEPTQRLAERFFEFAAERGLELVTSDVTAGECLFGAYKRSRPGSIERFEGLFEKEGPFRLVPATLGTLKEAARFGPPHGMKLLDAVHTVSAIEAGCDVFVTNDQGIRSAGAIRVVQLADV